ncbi:MAG: beta strand repeat-containing protein, partial [Pseudonocardiaceae bacterium]
MTAVAVGNSQITVTLNGGSATATVQVTPQPPTVSSLLPATLAITQGGTGTLTVTINPAQLTNTAVTLTSSASGIASVPSSVTVLAGQTTAPVPVSANTPGMAQITASLNGTSASSMVSVTPALPTVVLLLPLMNPVNLGGTVSLTVRISAAQATDTTVALSVSPTGIVTLPPSQTVTVLANQTDATFTVGTVALGTAMVTASLNGTSASASVQVTPPPPAVASLAPPTQNVAVGATGTLTVTLNVAQTTPTVVTLSVDASSVLQVPPSVTVPANQLSAIFTVTGVAVGDATVTATVGSSTRTALVHVIPPAPVAVSLLPPTQSIQQGANGTLTFTINAAQLTDTIVPLTNSNAAVLQVPSSVTVPAGQTSAPITVTGLTPGTATVSATLGGVTVTATVQVVQPPTLVTGITPATLSLPKGKPGTLRVAVSPAPAAATDVTLTSSDPSRVTVPPMVVVPTGALFADFVVTTPGEGSAVITAALNGSSATATVTVTPAEVVMLTLSPQNPSLFVGESQPFTATGTLTDGTMQNVTTQVTWTSSDETKTTINSGGVATALAVGTTTITASKTTSMGPVTASTTLTVLTPPQMQLIPSSASLKVGENLSLTLDAGAPAGTGGLTVTFAQTGTGTVTVPSSVVVLEGQTSVPVLVTGATAGSVTLTASATGRQSATATLTVTLNVPTITSFNPTSGQVGTTVTLTGTSFDPTAANNIVKFNGVTAAVTAATGTTITTAVPSGATTGLITVTNAGGTGTSAQPFTVINSAPVFTPIGNQTVALGSMLTFTATALDPDLQNVAFAVTPLPLPAHAAFDVQTGVFTFAPDATQAGTYTFTFSATDGLASSSQTITVTVTGAPPGGVTALFGRVDDTSQHPLANLPVTLKGTALTTTTNAQGEFTLSSSTMPTDRQTLLVDGFSQGYAVLAAPVDIIAGVMNQVPQPFTLPPVDLSTQVTVNPAATTVVTSATLNVSVTIPPNTAKNANGTPYTGVLTISPVPEYGRVEARPAELRPGLSITIQPAGVVMAAPVPITFPNVDAMPANKELDLWSLSPDTGTFNAVGKMRVSADGQRIETISGGVRTTAWHFVLAPPAASQVAATSSTDNCTTCGTASESDLSAGALSHDVTIPGVRTLGVARDLTLHYRSTSADVRPILPMNVTLGGGVAVPQTFSARLTVGGIQQGPEMYWNASGLPPAAVSTSRLGVQFDASTLNTGRYAYELMLFSNYAQSSIGGGTQGKALIRNERTSPFGSGWTLTGLDRLLPQSDGSLVLAKGSGGTDLYQQTGRPLVIESYGLTRSFPGSGANYSFVAGSVYSSARGDLLNLSIFGPAGVVPRTVTLRSGLNTLSLPALAGVDIMILNQPTIAESVNDVVVLEQFVKDGGALLEMRNFGSNRAVILNTFPGPFTSDSTSDMTTAGLASVLRQGPFGTAATPISMGAHATYAVIGSFTEIARSDLGPDVLQLQSGPSFGGTGRAVFIGDEDIFSSNCVGSCANLYSNNTTLFLNTIAFLAGAPGYRTPQPPPGATIQYVGPAGDFSTLVKNLDGTFTR